MIAQLRIRPGPGARLHEERVGHGAGPQRPRERGYFQGAERQRVEVRQGRAHKAKKIPLEIAVHCIFLPLKYRCIFYSRVYLYSFVVYRSLYQPNMDLIYVAKFVNLL